MGNVARVWRTSRYAAGGAQPMTDFPAFMKSPLNRIAAASQFTDDIEGYVFDGADGSQVAFWTCAKDRISKEHAHDFDEYVLVVEGRCTVIMGGQRTELRAGDECVVPKGTLQSMEVASGTRTVHVFGGKRAERARPA
jgi:quercetin dioxygenase-like cupin family protein